MHPSRTLSGTVPAVGGLVLAALAVPAAQAHHLLDINGLAPTVFNGLISGLAHPLIGPDHLLFLLALALLGLQRPRLVMVSLLSIGLLGSAAGLLWPNLPATETLLALTLVLEALVILGRLPAVLLVPAMALHGYALSGPVLGWSAMPLGSYLLGLLLSQGGLLLLSTTLLARVTRRLSQGGRRLLALALLGLGGLWALGLSPL